MSDAKLNTTAINYAKQGVVPSSENHNSRRPLISHAKPTLCGKKNAFSPFKIAWKRGTLMLQLQLLVSEIQTILFLYFSPFAATGQVGWSESRLCNPGNGTARPSPPPEELPLWSPTLDTGFGLLNREFATSVESLLHRASHCCGFSFPFLWCAISVFQGQDRLGVKALATSRPQNLEPLWLRISL